MIGLLRRLQRGDEMLEIWNKIPEDTDILVTHSPPLGYGDLNGNNERQGCLELLNTIRFKLQPKYHIYGHIHGGHGIRTKGVTTFVNAVSLKMRSLPTNPPIVFDLKKKE